MIAAGGFSKLAAARHILPWTPLVLMLAFAWPEGGTATYQMFLTVLLVANVISLAFDFKDVRLWMKSRTRT